MPKSSLWIDASNHNPITQDIIDDAKIKGYEGVVFNLLDLYPDGLLSQLALAYNNSMRLAGYVYLNFPGGDYYNGRDSHQQVTVQVNKVINAGFTLEFVALDCEDPGNNLTPEQTVAYIQLGRQALDEKSIDAIIYTAEYWWIRNTRNSNVFNGLPLWNATNDNQPDLNRINYGGWSSPKVEQFSFHTNIGGVEYDANIMEEGIESELQELNIRSLTDVEKVRLGVVLKDTFMVHFSDVVNTDLDDDYNVEVVEDRDYDVVLFTFPKGSVI